MIRQLITTTLLLISTIAATAAIEDTTSMLLNAQQAKEISITSTRRQTSITIRDVDNTGNSFHYQAGCYSRRITNSGATTQIMFTYITDITIKESESDITVSFTDTDGNRQNFDFDFADPDNRSVKSYYGDRGSDFGFPLNRSGRTQWSVVTRGIGFGWCSPLNDTPDMDISMWHSNEITWQMVVGVQMKRGRNSLTFGLGLDWQNYATNGKNYFHKDDDNRITLQQYDPEAYDTYSRIKLFSLQLPVTYGLNFGRRNCMGFNIGPVINFNTGSSIKTSYKLDKREYTVKTNNIGQRKVTVDLLTTINYQAIGLYVRYSPMKKLRTAADLDFNSITTGLMLCF